MASRIRSAIPHVAMLSIAALLLTLSGCTLNPSRTDVLGRYELRGIKSGSITLALKADGTYIEDISWSANHKDHRSGTWFLSGGNVDLSGLWIPPEFAPDYIINADQESTAPMPKYTEPGHWDLSGEKKWGMVFLVVFPDSDIEFKKVSGS
jgi:hypothetical protein